MTASPTAKQRRLAMHYAQHFVYELWAGDECLYIGMTSRLGQRLAAHARSPWFSLVTRVVADAVDGNRHDALREEFSRLDRHQPTHNIYGTDGRRTRLED